jgi:hypothetical protein
MRTGSLRARTGKVRDPPLLIAVRIAFSAPPEGPGKKRPCTCGNLEHVHVRSLASAALRALCCPRAQWARSRAPAHDLPPRADAGAPPERLAAAQHQRMVGAARHRNRRGARARQRHGRGRARRVAGRPDVDEPPAAEPPPLRARRWPRARGLRVIAARGRQRGVLAKRPALAAAERGGVHEPARRRLHRRQPGHARGQRLRHGGRGGTAGCRGAAAGLPVRVPPCAAPARVGAQRGRAAQGGGKRARGGPQAHRFCCRSTASE